MNLVSVRPAVPSNGGPVSISYRSTIRSPTSLAFHSPCLSFHHSTTLESSTPSPKSSNLSRLELIPPFEGFWTLGPVQRQSPNGICENNRQRQYVGTSDLGALESMGAETGVYPKQSSSQLCIVHSVQSVQNSVRSMQNVHTNPFL